MSGRHTFFSCTISFDDGNTATQKKTDPQRLEDVSRDGTKTDIVINRSSHISWYQFLICTSAHFSTKNMINRLKKYLEIMKTIVAGSPDKKYLKRNTLLPSY